MKQIALNAVLISLTTAVDRPYMRLVDNLEEPENLGFCFDLAGHGSDASFDNV